MNVFVAGVSDRQAQVGPASDAVRHVVNRIALLGAPSVETWSAPSGRAALVTASHDSDRIGGASYSHLESHRFASFSGRPVLWSEDGTADGRRPLDPRLYLEEDGRWADGLDGRCAVVRYDDREGELLVYTDSFGSYPVYRSTVGDTLWVSNNSAVLRRLTGSKDLRPDALARFMGCGWSLGGAPLWAGVERLPRARVTVFTGPQKARTRELLPVSAIAAQFDTGLSAEAAAHTLGAFAGAASDWDGRESQMTLTGGRDSRLVFGALVASGMPVTAVTRAAPELPGFPDTPDVVIARKLCEVTGTPHQTAEPQAREVDSAAAIAVFRLVTPGTFSFSSLPGDLAARLSGQIPYEARPVRLLFGGANGEISRAYYGLGDGMSPRDLSKHLLGRIVPRYPPTLLNGEGREEVRAYVRAWVDEHLAQGLSARDLPDGFYMLERMQNWGGPMHGVFEYRDDIVSPLWSREVVRHQVALEATQRSAGQFHAAVLRALAPQVAAIGFEGGQYGSGRRTRGRKLMKQAVAEGRRRLGPASTEPNGSADPLVHALPALREAALSQSKDHPVWSILQRRRVERLLRRGPERLDPRSREQCWRLAAVLGSE